ncbi:Os11g0438000 [Oryza sativa Japonica Group]|uniref:Uncharacterized protein n=2 Tax=Oryza sativa subsp. japonica TaxID=39947 RepID=A0A8J8XCE9_ORYSJ|nr:hypothetical protein OsJ_31162 [Oryza sativa Japonica Group]KAB8115135.1 hypothetical protein EE612_055234 [Oryza sativa]BAT13855.1 Os11g0438000 [Oryza sativa Japonica Group]
MRRLCSSTHADFATSLLLLPMCTEATSSPELCRRSAASSPETPPPDPASSPPPRQPQPHPPPPPSSPPPRPASSPSATAGADVLPIRRYRSPCRHRRRCLCCLAPLPISCHAAVLGQCAYTLGAEQ